MAEEERPVLYSKWLEVVQNVVDSMQYLSRLSSRDINTRKQAMDNIFLLVDQYLDGYGSPISTGIPGLLNGVDRKSYLQSMLPGFLRLATFCPFDDVREKCSLLLNEIKERGRDLKVPEPINVGPSQFIPYSEYQPLYVSSISDRLGSEMIGGHISVLDLIDVTVPKSVVDKKVNTAWIGVDMSQIVFTTKYELLSL